MNDDQQPEHSPPRHPWVAQLKALWIFASKAECPMYVWHLFTIQLNILLILIGLSTGMNLWVMLVAPVFMYLPPMNFWVQVRMWENHRFHASGIPKGPRKGRNGLPS